METATQQSDGQQVVVGFDGSEESQEAVRFGVGLARLYGHQLRIEVARGDLFSISDWADQWTQGLAEEWLEVAQKILAEEGFVGAELIVRDGLPSDVLVRDSAGAAIVVVGARGHGAVEGALQGSVSQHVSRHAVCPVVVVRKQQSTASRKVVVGVDGSDRSMEALEFALHFAGLSSYLLEVVYAPEQWRAYAVNPFAMPAPVPAIVEAMNAQESHVLARIGHVVARHPGVAVEVRSTPESAGAALVQASRDAQLVVVGSRGRHAFAELLLGSVSAHVLHRAKCPVAVVR